jgi:hypothetical protein
MRLTKQFLLILVVALLACAQATLKPVTDLTGDSSRHQLQTSGTAKWVLFIATSTNAAVVRIGDVNTSATRGATVAAGGGLMLPPIPPSTTLAAKDQQYDLTAIYYYATTGDKISVVWGN